MKAEDFKKMGAYEQAVVLLLERIAKAVERIARDDSEEAL